MSLPSKCSGKCVGADCVDGARLQVNHLGTVLLVLLLLPKLAATPGSPRVTIVASEMHYWVKSTEEFKADNILKRLNDPTGMTVGKSFEKYFITKRPCSCFPGERITDPRFYSIQRVLCPLTCCTPQTVYRTIRQLRESGSLSFFSKQPHRLTSKQGV
jgi:hypothetical protein